MNPGKELDALVAEKVMGWHCYVDPEPNKTLEYPIRPCAVCNNSCSHNIPRYSTDISAAWEVAGKLDGEWIIKGHESVGWEASFYSSTGGIDGVVVRVSAIAETAPHVICLGALKAAGIDV